MLAALAVLIALGGPFMYVAEELEEDDEFRAYFGAHYPQVLSIIKRLYDVDAVRGPPPDHIRCDDMFPAFVVLQSGRVLTMQNVSSAETMTTLKKRIEACDYEGGVPCDAGDEIVDVCFTQDGRMPRRIRELTADELKVMLDALQKQEEGMWAERSKVAWFSEARREMYTIANETRQRRKRLEAKYKAVLAAEQGQGEMLAQ